MTATHILGIDIAKRKFDVNLRTPREEENTLKGFKALLQWLVARGATQLHACLESTSRYGDALARFLYEKGYRVSMVNPRRTRHYADSRLVRTQNDTIDARLIADFCLSEQNTLATWEPLSPPHRKLQDLTRARMFLVEQKDCLANQLETLPGTARSVFQRQIQSLERHIASLEKAIQTVVKEQPDIGRLVRLADTVKGVGLVTAATVVAELPPPKKMRQARQAIAYAGLDPIHKDSGDTVATKPRLSHMGSPRLRKALYMPALVALRHNPLVRALGQRLNAKGKTGKLVVAAAMRKLLRLIFGVLKTGCPFDTNWANANAPKPPQTPPCS
jgi:transposase